MPQLMWECLDDLAARNVRTRDAQIEVMLRSCIKANKQCEDALREKK